MKFRNPILQCFQTLIIMAVSISLRECFHTAYIISPSVRRFKRIFLQFISFIPSMYVNRFQSKLLPWLHVSATHCIDYSILLRKDSRSQWPRGLRRRSSAARLLRLWVRIPRVHGCLFIVSVVCCQLEVSATD